MDASLGPPGPPLREHSPHSADPSKPYVGREAFKSLIDQTFLSLGREFDTNFDDLLLSEKTLLESTVAVQNHKRATKALENEVAQMKQTVGNPKDAQIERKEGQRRKVLSDNFCQTDPVSEFGLKDKSSPSKSLNLGVSQRSRRSAGGNATFQEEDEVMVSQSKPERRVTRSRTVAVSELHKTDRLAALTLELPGGVSGRGSANAPPQAAPRARRASVEDPDDISTVNLLGQNEALKGRVREYEKRIASLEAREKSLDMEKKKLLSAMRIRTAVMKTPDQGCFGKPPPLSLLSRLRERKRPAAIRGPRGSTLSLCGKVEHPKEGGRSDGLERWSIRRRGDVRTASKGGASEGGGTFGRPRKVEHPKEGGRSDGLERWSIRRRGDVRTASKGGASEGGGTFGRPRKVEHPKEGGRSDGLERWSIRRRGDVRTASKGGASEGGGTFGRPRKVEHPKEGGRSDGLERWSIRRRGDVRTASKGGASEGGGTFGRPRKVEHPKEGGRSDGLSQTP
uniref:Uncharacterized protein n=1 Tax=Chromera velia CCMP2878 TaxID=1169474 RepID=A0A0G4H0X6_9ALVE|eukprot:Cvel_24193.t1-p1 / transcript=Cvel_24193.t1 / gene=Cvel_24193 / organism=Chromera_velia_CCMP2878 / gene_product=Histone-lysine N-methyltransferase MLL2, putative / transcript_product=Histone-lysine N-methyltransferase MLL2, putative / location=Cvel_scaffold2584:7493-19625(-) / protein_length=509 / sequence_SO=supercontig / SO=protein_coding / is_pseudo=false